MTYTVHEADVLEALRAMDSDSFSGCLTDPPYGLTTDGGKTGFMGHAWDKGVPPAEVWREVLRVLKPGAHLLAFGGTRTFHRLTCAIEDAGFEIRDCMMWLYGSGFPKSHDVSKAIDREAGAVRPVVGPNPLAKRQTPKRGTTALGDFAGVGDVTSAASAASAAWSGYGSALKPAYEPVIVARKPLTGTLAANCQEHGCGGLAIDACRIGSAKNVPASGSGARSVYGHGLGSERVGTSGFDPNIGRWPANVIFSHHPNCVEAGTREVVSRGGNGGVNLGETRKSYSGGYKVQGEATGVGTTKTGTKYMRQETVAAYECVDGCPVKALDGQTGHEASRFFYCAKASRAERDAGLEGFAAQATSRYGEQGQGPTPQQTPRKPVEQRNVHPTVKPLALAAYLARLILPPVEGTRLLVPFCGSGSEMLGGLRAGWSHVEGIDSWDVAVKTARARLAHHEALLAKQDPQLALVRT